MRILVVEDEDKMAQVIKRILSEHGYIVDLAHDGVSGQQHVSQVQYDLLIIDVMLPREDGLTLCKKIRETDSSVPILILSALDATDDTVRGLEAGADDYMSKPFESTELIARIRALLRRGSDLKQNSVLTCNDLELDLTGRLAKRGGKIIQLTLKEFTLLEYLMRNQGRVLSRSQISERAWERPYDLNDNNVDVYINMLRKKVDKGYETPLIQTVVGVGYVIREPHV
ncbi:MAG: Two-component transcriptional response regulator, OmpR family [Cytophagales bacterium]|jgi:DNA-binding response OmpR family regulator|nr:response regulator transcription factor [Bacteroidota bacterium]MBS1982465.1 response regulator transcription factor [Bacteroidota bacterium]WHZ06268.1 MAG: Two-component transcriptional response regulator, OmpR family [Cytophagales bacterium]